VILEESIEYMRDILEAFCLIMDIFIMLLC
jgi:hypothetical protein